MTNKLNDTALARALRPFHDAIKGWSVATTLELDTKIVRAYEAIWVLKNEGGPHKKALSELKPLLIRQANRKGK